MKIPLPPSRRQTYDLREFGIREVPLLGACNHFRTEGELLPHEHGPCLEIHYLVQGEQWFYVDGRYYALRAGDLFVTWPDEVHGTGGRPHGRGYLYWLQVMLPRRPATFLGMAPAAVRDLLRDLRTLPARHFAAPPAVRGLFEEMFLLARSPATPHRALRLSTALLNWLSMVAQSARTGARARYSPDIAAVVEWLKRKPGEMRTVEQMARRAHLSVSRFKAKFKLQTGRSPHDFLMHVRVEAAGQLLRTRRVAVTDIALMLGFASSQHFATVFKRYTGQTPTGYAG